MKRYDSYKDSGIDWIGEIPEYWYVKKLKHLAKIYNGQDHKNVWDNKGAFPIIGTGGIFGMSNSFLTSGPSVILGRKGTIDKPQYIDFPFWPVDTTYYTEIYPTTNARYFYYLCTTINFELYKYGSALPSMTQDDLNQVPFSIPKNYQEQTAIAAFLDCKTAEIDRLIADKKRLIELYEEEKTAIINQAVTKGLNPDVKMKDSGIEWIGEIPEYWEVKRLKYVVSKVGSGVTPTGGATVYQSSGIPLLRSQNIHFEGIKLNDVAYISEEIHEKMSNSKVLEGDVLLNITGASIGRTYFAEKSLGEANVNQHVCILRPNEHIISCFFHLLLRSNIGQEQMRRDQTGSGREGLNFEMIKNFYIVLFDLSEQHSIITYLESECSRINAKVEKTKKLIALLTEYRTTLISEVVTGKIKVT